MKVTFNNNPLGFDKAMTLYEKCEDKNLNPEISIDGGTIEILAEDDVPNDDDDDDDDNND